MAAYTLTSTTKPALLAEVARRVVQAEQLLASPLNRIQVSFGGGLMQITGFVRGTMGIVAASGVPQFVPTNHTPGDTLILAGTALDARGIDSLAEALVAAIVDLAGAETTYIADGTKTLPNGVDASFSINEVQCTINASVPFTVSVNGTGQQVITVSNYMA